MMSNERYELGWSVVLKGDGKKMFIMQLADGGGSGWGILNEQCMLEYFIKLLLLLPLMTFPTFTHTNSLNL